MIGNKIKALLNYTNKSSNDACKKLNIINAAYYRKISKNTFKAEELIKLSILTNTKLAFIDEKGKSIITFDESDIEEKDTEK